MVTCLLLFFIGEEQVKPNNALGELIRKCRRERGETQVEFGRLLSTAYINVSRWETGYCKPPKSLLVQLAGVTGQPLDQFEVAWLESSTQLQQPRLPTNDFEVTADDLMFLLQTAEQLSKPLTIRLIKELLALRARKTSAD